VYGACDKIMQDLTPIRDMTPIRDTVYATASFNVSEEL
jgi:hypothetical protein